MRKPRKKIQYKAINRSCPFCKNKKEPSYKEIRELEVYLSDRARILPATRTGLCFKHQKRLTRAVKQARVLALLPIIEKI